MSARLPQSGSLDVYLRMARVRAGMSQGDLATRAGVTRQAISAIESGKTAPTMGVALRLARALGCRVDELFRLVDELPRVTADLLGDGGATDLDMPIRVQVAEINGRIVAHPLSGAAGATLTIPRANGIIRAESTRHGQATVELFSDPDQLSRMVVAVGCDPAMWLLADHLHRRHPTMELTHQGGNSLNALQAVARGEAHLAGCHLIDAETGEPNGPVARRMLGNEIQLVNFAVWQQGLMVQAGNPRGIQNAADLARSEIRLANREDGSGARALLDIELERLGIKPDQVSGYNAIVRSHLAAAEAVAAGLAHAAVGIRAAAQALGLGFIPLAWERYDLVIPNRNLELPAVQALIETLSSPLFRLEIEALGGYDVSHMGETMAQAA
ncbi:MAG: substrate-binding domain-containing protein [Chloroflexota bacterium]